MFVTLIIYLIFMSPLENFYSQILATAYYTQQQRHT